VSAKGGAATGVRAGLCDHVGRHDDAGAGLRHNGIAFDKSGNAYTANTGTGEIQRLEVKPGYTLGAITTLVKSPLLLGADGLMFDESGNLFVTANYRNALLLVTPEGQLQLVTNDRPGHRADSAQVRVSPGWTHGRKSGVLRFPA
jgi:sugar lactone lactonase YvrE